MKIKRFRQLFAELRELPPRFSGEYLREFYERYVPQPSTLQVARIPVRSERRTTAPARQRRR